MSKVKKYVIFIFKTISKLKNYNFEIRQFYSCIILNLSLREQTMSSRRKACARMEHCVREPGIPPDVTVHLVTMEIDVVRQPIFSRAIVNAL